MGTASGRRRRIRRSGGGVEGSKQRPRVFDVGCRISGFPSYEDILGCTQAHDVFGVAGEKITSNPPGFRAYNSVHCIGRLAEHARQAFGSGLGKSCAMLAQSWHL